MSATSSRLRVMVLTSSMRRGGSASFASILLEHLDRGLFAPELAMMSDAEPEYTIPPDVPVTLLTRESGDGVAAVDLPPDVVEVLADNPWAAIAIRQIASLVRRSCPDVVFTTPEWMSALAAAAAPHFPASTHLICRVDAPPSMAFPGTGTDHPYGVLVRRYFNEADQVVAVSPAIVEDLVANFEVDRERIVPMRNLVDVSRAQVLGVEPVHEISFDDGVPSVVFVGRMERVKGLDHLLRAMAQVVKVVSSRCVIVGEGSQEGYLRALSKHLGLEDRVVFVGTQTNPFKFMSKATTFVLPSLSEGMPTVLIEAMACGCPVIATDIAGGATRELLEEGACGLIVPRGDTDALAEAILRMLQDGVLREELSRMGLERAAEFDLPKIIQENQDLLLSVARTGPGGGAESRASRDAVFAEESVVASERAGTASEGHESRRTSRAPSGTGSARSGARHRAPRLLKTARLVRQFRPRHLMAAASRMLHGSRDVQRHSVSAAEESSDQLRRARSSAGRRPPGRMHLTVLVWTTDTEYMGTRTNVLLEHLDRTVYDVSLVRIFDQQEAGGVFEDVDQFVVETRTGFATTADYGLTDEIVARYEDELTWMTARARCLGELARELKTDAILAQGLLAATVATMAKEYLPEDTVTIASMLSFIDIFDDSWPCSDLYGALARSCIDRADVVVAPTRTIEAGVVELLGVETQKVTVIPEPIEVCEVGASESSSEVECAWLEQDAPLFLCVVEPGSPADLFCLLEALSIARQQEDVRCAILGDVKTDVDLEDVASQLGIGDAVASFEGRRNFRAFLRSATAYIRAVSEAASGISPVLVDAISSGCAVVSTRSYDASSDFVEEAAAGAVVPVGDAEALAEAMLQMVWDDDARQDMVRRASEHLKTYSAESVVRRFEQVIAGAIRDRNGVPSQG